MNITFAALGLALDALGAILLVVPDLPDSLENKFRRVTPKIRIYHRVSQQLREGQIDDSELEASVRRIWPVPINHATVDSRRRITPASVDSIEGEELQIEDIGSVKWGQHHSTVLIKDENGDHLIGPSCENIVLPIEYEIQKLYRVFGLLLLSTGFALQLFDALF